MGEIEIPTLPERQISKEDFSAIMQVQYGKLVQTGDLSEKYSEFFHNTVKSTYEVYKLQSPDSDFSRAFDIWLTNYPKYGVAGAETMIHSMEAAELAVQLAIAVNVEKGEDIYTTQDLRDIRAGMLIHDIGKIITDDGIEFILKPGVSEADKNRFRLQHVAHSIRIVDEQFKDNIVMRNVVGEHHEKWNGRGYPVGKDGHKISKWGEIAYLADDLDALVCPRVYRGRKGLTAVAIGRILRDNFMAGHYDIDLMTPLMKILRDNYISILHGMVIVES